MALRHVYNLRFALPLLRQSHTLRYVPIVTFWASFGKLSVVISVVNQLSVGEN